jgi:hypothetical protein
MRKKSFAKGENGLAADMEIIFLMDCRGVRYVQRCAQVFRAFFLGLLD